MPLTLPPLNALRAFEAAARTGGYVGAAAELGISPAAVSQQVRKLEDFLGKKVFARLNNRVVLTDAGQALFEGFGTALQMISDTTEAQMLRRTRSRLVISCIGSLAERWLLPRLAAHAAAHPGFRFDLRVEPDPVDFARHDIDLRLAYDPTHYPDQAQGPLVRDRVLPLCSPGWLTRNAGARGMAQVAGEHLLHTSWGPDFGSLPGWPEWFAAAALPMPVATQGFQSGSSALVLDMAREGLGIALGQALLAQDDLAAGRLITLSDVALPLGHAYALVWPRARTGKRHLADLVKALQGAASG
ncbi:LysR substrate-binding domain-containing protein [Rhodobacter sp.]